MISVFVSLLVFILIADLGRGLMTRTMHMIEVLENGQAQWYWMKRVEMEADHFWLLARYTRKAHRGNIELNGQVGVSDGD